MTATGSRDCWAEVDLTAIAGNVAAVLERAAVPVMAVVKADAYGHGALPVARAALRAGATWLGVARFGEALALREAGIDAPVLLLGHVPPDLVPDAVRLRLSLTVWSAGQVEVASEAGRRTGVEARLHLKVDTGMGRLGVDPDDAVRAAAGIQAAPGARLEGLFTHLACADEPSSAVTARQEEALHRVVAALEACGLRPPVVHAANSAAALRPDGPVYDLVRLGIAMYGLRPGESPLPEAFRPALTWKSVLTHVRTVPPGHGIGYGHDYTTGGHERIGTVAVGYADGLRRAPGNRVLVGGRIVPVVGRVCMDQCMVLLDAVPEARPGEEVVLIGRQGRERIGAEDVGRRWNTINYEVVCAIGARVPRVYPPGHPQLSAQS